MTPDELKARLSGPMDGRDILRIFAELDSSQDWQYTDGAFEPALWSVEVVYIPDCQAYVISAVQVQQEELNPKQIVAWVIQFLKESKRRNR